MTRRSIEVQGSGIELLRTGKGAPLIYLHGFADVHGASAKPCR